MIHEDDKQAVSPTSSSAPEEAEEASASSRREFFKQVSGSVVGVGLGGISGTALTTAQLVSPAAAATSCASDADPTRWWIGGAPIRDCPDEFQPPQGILNPLPARVSALKDLLISKRVVAQQGIDGFVQYYSKTITPMLGAAVVVQAWQNPSFKQALLNPPSSQPFYASLLIRNFLTSAINPIDGKIFLDPANTFGLTLGPEGEYIRVVANGVLPAVNSTTGLRIHNLVVCTVCSCYPQALLGVQPTWYKSQQYRARAMGEPFGVLKEFAEDAGHNIDAYLASINELRVWDANSEVRFFVIPEMPRSWAGLSSSDKLKRVTRNSMVGTEILYD
jgi:nitrile hydratase